MIIACLMMLSAGAMEFVEPFDYADGTDGAPTWLTESVAWEVTHGTLAYEGGGRSFAVFEKAPCASEVAVETTMIIHERARTDWAVAGVCIRLDKSNYWHLALIESPSAMNKNHQIELTEMLDGVWLAQSNEATRVTPVFQQGGDFRWEYGRAYRLRLVLTPQQIEGFVFEADGTQRAHLGYKLDNRAVKIGRSALDCGNFRAAFDDVKVTVAQTVPASTAPEAQFPPYAQPGNSNLRAEPRGFFYTKQIDGRWWLIDPNGYSFYIVGTDHVNYQAHWCQKLGYAPYARNVAAKYGNEKAWGDAELDRLADWHFNALPAGHSPSLRYRRFPHIEFLSLGTSFSDVDNLCPKTTWTGFPNVFNPKWTRHCDLLAREACGPAKEDPWLIGYFLDNELEWFGKSYSPWGLFDEAWKKPPEHTAKQAWVAFLKQEIGSPAEFGKLWGVTVSDFDALAAHVQPAAPLTDTAKEIARRWTRRVADEYFRVCVEAIRRHDPNHLILGCRFAGDAPDVWDIAGRHCDIVAFNTYPRIDVEGGVPQNVRDQIAGWAKSAAKPMMVTEWSFPALDAGLPSVHGAGMRVDTQAQRAQCFTHFQTYLFSLPYMVGSDYFMFADEPAEGISDTFPEDSNYGLVNVNDEPYPELTAAARSVNARVYDLHTAASPPAAPVAQELAPCFSSIPESSLPVPEKPLTLTAGGFQLEGPLQGHAWHLAWEGKPLAVFYPLLHQASSASLWVQPDAARVVAVRQDAHVTVVDMELARGGNGDVITRVDDRTGQRAPATVQAFRYRTGWRFWIPRNGTAWLAAECLWVENTDSVPWRLMEVFQYVVPAIGGDSAGDEPLMGAVPNYYQRGAAWIDKAAGLGVGCWYPSDEAFECSYWKDPGGGFHSDLRERINRELAPGQRLDLGRGPAFTFPLTDVSRTGFAAAVARVKQAAIR